MQKELVIDGTDIICNHTEEPLLAPLLQLLLHLHQEKVAFYCYFDADTRYRFTRDLDKQIYQSIIDFGLNDYFNQTTGGRADRMILRQATDINGTVLSSNRFEQFVEDFSWITQPNRIITPQINAQRLTVDALQINLDLNLDLITLTVQLINSLEQERNNLTGIIQEYKADKSFGFIQRPIGSQKLFFHKDAVADKTLDITAEQAPVSFAIDMNQTGGIYYFCAVDIKKHAVSEAETVRILAQERAQLSASKDFLQQQVADLKKGFEQQLQSVFHENEQLKTENETLLQHVRLFDDNQKNVLRHIEAERSKFEQEITQLGEVIQQKDTTIEALKREIELLNAQRQAAIEALDQQVAESKSQAMTIDFQQQKINNLDEDLKAVLRIVQMPQLNQSDALAFEQLKQEYNILLKTVAQKNSQITFLNNNLQDLQTQLKTTSNGTKKSDDIEELIAKVHELEKSNQQLKNQIEQLEINLPKANENQSQPYSDNQMQPTVVSLSDEAKQQRPEKPKKVIVEATREELENWWNNLEEQWKIAFNQSVLNRGESTSMPAEDQLRSLFKRKKIDIVGNGILFFGLNQLSIKLSNLSGLKELSQIEDLNISGHDLTNLHGIEHFENLQFLNCTSNNLTTIEHILHLKNLKSLNLQDNSLSSLIGVEKLTNLTYINCLYNGSLKSIVNVQQLAKLETFKVDNYKTMIRLELEKLIKEKPNLDIRNV